MKKVAFVFPGQGSQSAGMGLELYESSKEARALVDAAHDALRSEVDLRRLLFEGSAEDLALTANTQPAVLTVSLAAHAALSARLPYLRPALVAGHSLGEYSALVAAGALRPVDALRVVRRRGELMQQAVPEGRGAMAAVMGLEPAVVAQACRSYVEETGQVLQAANLNSSLQTVISGEKEAVEGVASRLRSLGARRVRTLPVSAPFHSSLMEPVRPLLKRELSRLEMRPAEPPLVSNVDASVVDDPDRIRTLLVEQVASPVRWMDVVQAIARAGVTDVVELGPGRVLCGLVRGVDETLVCHNVEKPGDLESVAEALEGCDSS